MSSSTSFTDIGDKASRPDAPPDVRGWLLVYMIGLVLQALHGLGLTGGAIVIFADPKVAGLTSFVPLSALLFYVFTNVALALYTAVVLALMIRRRKAAILNNIVLNCLAVLFLILWHLLGEKSPFGAIVDSVPGLVGLGYILRSKRVRGTFVRSRAEVPVPLGAYSP